MFNTGFQIDKQDWAITLGTVTWGALVEDDKLLDHIGVRRQNSWATLVEDEKLLGHIGGGRQNSWATLVEDDKLLGHIGGRRQNSWATLVEDDKILGHIGGRGHQGRNITVAVPEAPFSTQSTPIQDRCQSIYRTLRIITPKPHPPSMKIFVSNSLCDGSKQMKMIQAARDTMRCLQGCRTHDRHDTIHSNNPNAIQTDNPNDIWDAA
ncbi:hypothetical protein Btru_059837 [Bulinus truncatus]|nr:hypothetical protein Btru_059837 [Bulinus truncatus]